MLLCAEIADFTLHLATRCRADDRHRLARLRRYVMRPAFADDHLRWDGGSRVSFELKILWRDGTTHLEMTPVDFLERLAALMPRPRLHLVRFHGILAPNAKLRDLVVAKVPAAARCEPGCHDRAAAGAGAARMEATAAPPGLRWPDLPRRVCDIDRRRCPNCGRLRELILA
jgi:hypothetical protein